MPKTKVRKNPWSQIGREIWHRMCNFGKSPKFIAYMFIGIIGVGGVGVWLPATMDPSDKISFLESQNVFTYSVAILGTLFIEAFFGSRNNNLAAIGLIFGVVVFLICCVAYVKNQTGLNGFLNFGAFCSLFLFLMANVNDERFDEEEYAEPEVDAIGFKNADAKNIQDKV